MNRKVYVHQLRPGMHVAELDRPWSKAPFEPPFELQAFTLRTQDEINKVRDLCEYVMVDPAKSSVSLDAVADVPVLETAGADSHATAVAASVPPEPAALSDLERTVEQSMRITWREQRYTDEQAKNGAPAPSDSDHDDALVIERVDGEGVKDIFSGHVYKDTVTVEGELDAAREVLIDTEEVFQRMSDNLRNDKPLDIPRIKANIESLVESVLRNPDALSLLTRLKQQDGYTYSHAMAVCVLAVTLGRFLGMSQNALRSLGMGTLLQDVGKLNIPTELLQKHDALTDEERFTVSQHVSLSLNMLATTSDFPVEALDIVRHHHERFDGSGYPHGIAGEAISPFSIIAGLADTYEAMTNERPYRDALNSYEALGELYAQRDQLFPGAMVENLIHCVGAFPVGSVVELDNGTIGIVVGRNETQQLKPKVMIVLNAKGDRVTPCPTIDLATSDPTAGHPTRVMHVVDADAIGINPGEFFL